MNDGLIPISEIGVSGYQPGRSILCIGLFVGFLIVLTWDLAPYLIRESESLHEESISLSSSAAEHYLHALAKRTLDSPYQNFLLYIFIVLLLFQFVQLVAVKLDLRAAISLTSRGAYCQLHYPAWLRRIMVTILVRPESWFQQNAVLYQDPNCGLWNRHLSIAESTIREPGRFGIWAFPMLGFIGTVVGVSLAIRELPTVLQSQDAAGSQPLLDNLYLAFDTTFLGLACALLISLLDYTLASLWAQLDTAIDIAKSNSLLSEDDECCDR